MSNIDCNACNDLREYAPEFAQNGVTSTVATSLQNNTGFNPNLTVLHEDCEDLNDANDCLIGRMDQEIEAYEMCDWKEFMHKFLPNLYDMLKAIIASICGLWIQVDRLWCWMRSITTEPKTYTIHAYEDDDPTKPAINGFRIADGVRMSTGFNTTPIRVTCMGNVAYSTGTLWFDGNMPTDYTNGESVPWSYLQHGCNALTNKAGLTWGQNGVVGSSAVLIWEIQFKKCQLGFSRIFGRARLGPSNNGDFFMHITLYKKGDKVPPDYSTRTNPETGEYYDGWYVFNPTDDDMMLMQVRLQNTRVPLTEVTPNGNFNVVACASSLDC